MVWTYSFVFAGTFAFTAVLIWLLCLAAPRLGLVDHPHGRKFHAGATPVVGGLAIFSATALATLLLVWANGGARSPLGPMQDHLGFAAGMAILVLMGVIDDWRPIPARYKLLVQLVCCVLAVFADGAMVGDIGVFIGPYTITLGPLVGPFSVLVMLTVTNAINMIDGIDGLAGGVSLVALAIMAKAVTSAGFTSAPYVLALIGALTAFLAFNFPILSKQKAKVFLGDSGSLLFGFALAYMAIQLSALPGRVFKPSTGLWLFFIPVADTVWLYMRRMWIARAPFAAGRDHIHHLLMERFSSRMTAWILVTLSAVLAGGAYLAERKGVDNSVMILSWIAAFLAFGPLTHRAWKRAWHRSRLSEAPADDAVDIDPKPAPS